MKTGKSTGLAGKLTNPRNQPLKLLPWTRRIMMTLLSWHISSGKVGVVLSGLIKKTGFVRKTN